MRLKDIVERMPLSVGCGADRLDEDVRGGYAGDLLSDVIANSAAGDLWITMQVHVNIVAVAVLKDLAGIILIGGREPAEETLRKATSEHVPILLSRLSAFETAGKLYSIINDDT